MKIEKGKLYLNTEDNTLFKADFDSDNYGNFASDKVAVHCPTKEDWDYVINLVGNGGKYDYTDYEDETVVYIDRGYYASVQWAKNQDYHIITIDQFKEFYPPDVEHYDDPYNWGSIIIDTDNYRNNTLEANSKEYSMKTDMIVQNVVKKYQERSEVGIKKYNTTLQENSDGVEVFLNHLQEELMDATLYIEKLKQQVKQLKDII